MRGHPTGPACRRGRGRRRQWPSCPIQHRPRHLTTTTSAPTIGCWRRCTSSTRPIPALSTRPGLPTSGPTEHRAPATVSRSRPLRSPAGPHRRRSRKQRSPNPPPGRAHQSPPPPKPHRPRLPRKLRRMPGSSPRPLPPPTVSRPRRSATPPSRGRLRTARAGPPPPVPAVAYPRIRPIPRTGPVSASSSRSRRCSAARQREPPRTWTSHCRCPPRPASARCR